MDKAFTRLVFQLFPFCAFFRFQFTDHDFFIHFSFCLHFATCRMALKLKHFLTNRAAISEFQKRKKKSELVTVISATAVFQHSLLVGAVAGDVALLVALVAGLGTTEAAAATAAEATTATSGARLGALAAHVAGLAAVVARADVVRGRAVLRQVAGLAALVARLRDGATGNGAVAAQVANLVAVVARASASDVASAVRAVTGVVTLLVALVAGTGLARHVVLRERAKRVLTEQLKQFFVKK